MNRYRLFIVIGVAALVSGRLINPVVHAQDDESDSIRDQLRTMTKILEASIGNDSIDRRLARSSIFESRIRAEYIPTVGVIFTIPITFPLHPSEDEKENGTEEGVEEDLWEHFSRTSERTSKAAVPGMPPIEPIEPLKIQIDLEEERLDERVVRIQTQAQQLKAKTYAIAQGFAWDFSIGGSTPYDPVKVSKLTRTIIETIAQYGHRLESMPNSERILVVIEAPGMRGPGKLVGAPTERKDPDNNPQWSARENDKAWSGAIIQRSNRQSRLGLYELPNIAVFRRGKLMSPFSSKEHYDRRLLAFKKSDLQQERSYDSIKGKVETTDY